MKRMGRTDNSDILIHHMLILRLLTVASLFNYIGKLYIRQAQMLFFCHDGRDLGFISCSQIRSSKWVSSGTVRYRLLGFPSPICEFVSGPTTCAAGSRCLQGHRLRLESSWQSGRERGVGGIEGARERRRKNKPESKLANGPQLV